MLKLHYLLLGATIAAGALLLSPATRAEELSEGTGIVCDTQAQAEKFFTGYKLTDDIGVRLAEINATTAHSCEFMHVLYKDGHQVSKREAPDGFFLITRITIIGALTRIGWVKFEPEEEQYTAFFEKAQGV